MPVYLLLSFSLPHAHHPDLHSFPTRRSSDLNPNNPEGPRPTAQQDPWHYSIARMVDACTSAGILPFYGPYGEDRKSTRLNSSHRCISYAVFCLKKKKRQPMQPTS